MYDFLRVPTLSFFGVIDKARCFIVLTLVYYCKFVMHIIILLKMCRSWNKKIEMI